MDVDKLIAACIKLKDKKQELADKHREELAPYNEKINQIEAAIQEKLTTDKLKSLKTEAGTAYLSEYVTYKIDNLNEVWQYAKDNNIPDLFERRVNKTVAKEHGEVPGTERSSIYRLNIRRS